MTAKSMTVPGILADLEAKVRQALLADPSDDRFSGLVIYPADRILALVRIARAAQTVWDTVPSTYDPADPVVRAHAEALNRLGKLLASHLDAATEPEKFSA